MRTVKWCHTHESPFQEHKDQGGGVVRPCCVAWMGNDSIHGVCLFVLMEVVLPATRMAPYVTA